MLQLLTLIGVLVTLAGKEGQWAMIFLVTEASKSRLLIPATSLKYEWRAGTEL
jgi:hypothetical protein